jgi:hypothetical protein
MNIGVFGKIGFPVSKATEWLRRELQREVPVMSKVPQDEVALTIVGTSLWNEPAFRNIKAKGGVPAFSGWGVRDVVVRKMIETAAG